MQTAPATASAPASEQLEYGRETASEKSQVPTGEIATATDAVAQAATAAATATMVTAQTATTTDAVAQGANAQAAEAATENRAVSTGHSAPQPLRRPLVSGTSLSELISGAANPGQEQAEAGKTGTAEPPQVDPACAQKLERSRDGILKLMQQKRPRFVAAFEQMTFRDHAICLSVPTPELRDEILRSKTGMLMRIAELAGIEGRIELEIAVEEQVRVSRPIKLEDRVKYMTEKNPLVAELRKALDLEVE